MKFLSMFVAVLAALWIALPAVPAFADPLSPDELKFFETKIRPVLIKECYGCHSSKSGNVRGGLRLDSKELMAIGGSSGAAIVPGDLDESLLYNAILHEDFVMPPKRKLSPEVIDDFRKWIEMGAPDPRINKVVEIRSSISEQDIAEARENFWAYKLPASQEPPSVDDSSWPETPIDQFVLARLETAGMSPAADAEASKVLRRLCFDLIGLPPTPEQIQFFATRWKQDPDQAVAMVVDRLLDQDQFGERWGRHWLDVARYAESTGREVNMTFPHAWRYRDYVIDSFNEDKPFDQFVQEQLAGDLLPAKDDEEWAGHLIATTFLAMGPKNVNQQNRVQFNADLVDEQIDATTRVFLGTSVACARCHDHKFDPIPQTDYYALAGVFRSATTYWGIPPSEFGTFGTPQTKRSSSLLLLPVDDPNPYDKRYTASELATLKDELTGTLRTAAESRRNRFQNGGDAKNAARNRIRNANILSGLSAKLAVVDENGNPRSYCMGVQERGSPQDAKLLIRGEIDQPAQTVARGFPQVLCSIPVSIDSNSSGRLAFAKWIGSSQNPLTARVMVNRIWQHLIGKGIVTSSENFGSTGQAPSHPELLDYLAVRFMESGWSVKAVVREIATSRVYRIDSTYNQRNHEYDPDNALVWRANSRRLDAESIRDAMLSISGELDNDRPRGSEVAKAGYVRVRDGMLVDRREAARKAFENAGKETRDAMRARFQAGGFRGARRRFASRGNGSAGDRGRSRGAMDAAMRNIASRIDNALDMEEAKFRSVYLPIVRDEEPRSLEVFDFADSSAVTGLRESSNTANQALYMMNNRFVIQQSQAFARRVAKSTTRPNEQIELAFVLAFGRPPSSSERSATAAFARSFNSADGDRSRSEETLSVLCQSLMASAEFRYVD